MPVLAQIRDRFAKTKPLAGVRIGACLHVTTETANLMLALQAGGAEIALCASNPLSTQDDVAAALCAHYGIPTYAIKGEAETTYYSHIESVIASKPHMSMDDGCDLVTTIYTKHNALLKEMIGGCEETTTGVIRLHAMEKDGVLPYPVIAVNDALTKHMFDNRYGTGQSTLDGIIRATNALIAGSTVVVVGYGWCGRGVASRAKGLGAHVVVTEIDAAQGARSEDGRLRGDADGGGREARPHLHHRHRQLPRDPQGALRGDARRRDRLQLGPLQRRARPRRARGALDRQDDAARVRRIATRCANGRTVRVLGQGRLINLAAGEGHPASVMDMSFANQAMAAAYLAQNYKTLEKKVYSVPDHIDEEVAQLKLAAFGITIDTPTPSR